MSNNNNKVKGLLKGLRFISQIFDSDDKEPEIQIGHPTDVKHVAHIGWEGQGPSENNPSWMNEFQSVPGNSSAPLNRNGDIHSKGSDNSVQMAFEGQVDIDDLPKSSKRQSNSMGNIRESHAKEKSDRPRQARKSSKPNDLFNESMHTDADSLQPSDLPPKRSRPKISKDGSNVIGGSSKSRSKHNHPHSRDSNSNHESNPRSSSKSRNKQRRSFEDEQFESVSSENILKNYPN